MHDFIDDGYTEDFKIAAEEKVHGELTGKRRPASLKDRATIIALSHKLEDQPLLIDAACALMPKYVLTWSMTDTKGAPVKISREGFAGIRSKVLFDKLVDEVFTGSDEEKTEGDLKN